jgi:hypothetical protein
MQGVQIMVSAISRNDEGRRAGGCNGFLYALIIPTDKTWRRKILEDSATCVTLISLERCRYEQNHPL